MVEQLQVGGYRSLYDVALSLTQVTVIVGANGCGKSNLYKSLRLLQCMAEGTFAGVLAEEGGMPSALWAGRRYKSGSHKKPVQIRMGVTMDGFRYGAAVGLPTINDLPAPFHFDPVLKEETLHHGSGTKGETLLMDRSGQSVWVRDEEGQRHRFTLALGRAESALTGIRAGQRFPHLAALRERLLDWRFYHQFRTDSDAPLRQPQVGVFTPVLSHDGRDLAAALATIQAVGQVEELETAVDRAFPGGRLSVVVRDENRFAVELHQPGVLRPLTAPEMSDGTMRYFCLLAALLSPRPPSLLALNEPETSLHPDLLLPLAALIAKTSEQSQVWVTTHSTILADAIAAQTGRDPVRLEMRQGETVVLPD